MVRPGTGFPGPPEKYEAVGGSPGPPEEYGPWAGPPAYRRNRFSQETAK